MTSAALAALVTALLVAAVELMWLRAIRRNGNRALRVIWLGCLLLGVAVAIQPVHPEINSLAGFNLTWPVQHVLVVGAALALRSFFTYSVHGSRRVRPHLASALVVSAALVGLFALAGDQIDTRFGPGAPWSAVAAAALYDGYLGVTVVSIGLLSWRWAARETSRRWLRRGLRTIAVGCLGATAFVLHDLVYMAVSLAGDRPFWPDRLVNEVVAPVSVAVSVFGAALPTLGPRASAAVRAWRRRRAHRRLYPLWAALHTAAPQIAMDPPRTAWHDRVRMQDADWLLYRRIIEIWDGRSQIGPYVDNEVRRRAAELGAEAGLTGEDLSALVEAAGIASGLARAEHTVTAEQEDSVPALTGTADLAAEVAWWTKVAVAFDRSPLVPRSQH
ncbi:MAB_1171c family putative transporter [Kutzneria albida]|uniref:Putative membrane protein n=1 Tax=Kutzneria albida DSM 43870 TaxID=1449976 RepID=W5W007_9PSEU|nr:MAB_1171c family putative transporter [Kutzneria albida]AHH94127.1 putative membrane protein [Kutzneria albida DSM 43870]